MFVNAMCDNTVDVGAELAAVVVTVASGCSLDSRRLNISREASTFAKLGIVSAVFSNEIEFNQDLTRLQLCLGFRASCPYADVRI